MQHTIGLYRTKECGAAQDLHKSGNFFVLGTILTVETAVVKIESMHCGNGFRTVSVVNLLYTVTYLVMVMLRKTAIRSSSGGWVLNILFSQPP